MLQAGGGALWAEGKDAGAAAGDSELRNSPKRSGLEQGWVSGPDGSRRGSNGSAAEGHPEKWVEVCRSLWPKASAVKLSKSQPAPWPLRPKLRRSIHSKKVLDARMPSP